MYIAKMQLKINGVVYEKNSEVSDAMLKGVNVDYLKDVGAIVETVPSEEPKGKKAAVARGKKAEADKLPEKGEGDM